MDGGYYKSLTRNLVMVMVLVSLAPLVLISGIIGHRFETSYRRKVSDHLQEVVDKHQQTIDGFLYDKLAHIRVMGDTCDLGQLGDSGFLRERLAVLQRACGGGFVDLGFLREDGVQIAYAGPFNLLNADYSGSQWFRDALDHPFSVSDVFLGLRGKPHFTVSVRLEKDGVKRVLRATVDFIAFSRLVESIRIGKTGLAYVVNSRGEMQTALPTGVPPNLEFILHSASELFGRAPGSGEPAVSGAVAGSGPRSVVSEGPDGFGNASLYVMTPLKNGGWVLVFQQETSDALADLLSTRRLALIILFFGGLAIAVKAVILSFRMVGRIAGADREKEIMNERMVEASKLASLGELAAGIAHEINNPVAIMVEEAGWVEDLLEEEDVMGSPNLEEFRRALAQIRIQGARCREITHKLLSFARKTDHRPQEVRLNEVLDDVVGLSRQRIKFGNIRLTTRFADDLPVIRISPSEMQQVFLNFINNAVDAVDEKTGGEITVSTRLEGENIRVFVADDGMGIPQESLQRIFDPFYTTKPVGKGTGLGLSICYGIIRKWGGRIEVESVMGAGTVFRIWLPLNRDEENSGAEDASPPASFLKTDGGVRQKDI